MVVVNGNVDLLCAIWLLFWVVELSDVRMLECLLSSESSVWVEMKKVLQKVKSLWSDSWELVLQLSWLGWWQTLQHSLGNWTVDAVYVLLSWSSCDFHDSVELVES